jgi:hypothetical protein
MAGYTLQCGRVAQFGGFEQAFGLLTVILKVEAGRLGIGWHTNPLSICAHRPHNGLKEGSSNGETKMAGKSLSADRRRPTRSTA